MNRPLENHLHLQSVLLNKAHNEAVKALLSDDPRKALRVIHQARTSAGQVVMGTHPGELNKDLDRLEEDALFLINLGASSLSFVDLYANGEESRNRLVQCLRGSSDGIH